MAAVVMRKLGVLERRKRQAELLKVSGISQSDYDQAVLQIHSINADIEILKAQIRKTEIYAPFDGVIGLKNISIGAQVTPNTPIATIRAVQKLKLDFSVPEKYSDELRSGLKVTFTVQGNDTKYDAVDLWVPANTYEGSGGGMPGPWYKIARPCSNPGLLPMLSCN